MYGKISNQQQTMMQGVIVLEYTGDLPETETLIRLPDEFTPQSRMAKRLVYEGVPVVVES